VVDALDGAALVELHAAPAVRAFLARGVRAPIADDPAAVLLALVGLDAGSGRAALARFGAGLDAESCWSDVELLHLAPTLDSVRLQRLGTSLTVADHDALLGTLAARLTEEGALLDVARRQVRWSRALALRDPHPAKLDGGDAREVLEAHRTDRDHLRLALELQMLLHRHPLNESRAARGALTANAPWFHGTGFLPATLEPRFGATRGSDPLLAGLARRMGVPHDATAHASGPGLVRCAAPLAPALASAALAALGAGAISNACLHLPPLGAWRLGRGARWRFWRRTPSLAALLAEEA